MSCNPVTFRSFDRALRGLRTATSHGDGYTMSIEWYKSYITPYNWDMVYNIYWSTEQSDVYTDGVKFIADAQTFDAEFFGAFRPGQVYHFGVKASGHEPGTLDIDLLPEVDGLKMYPEGVLVEDISDTDLMIPVDDASVFPPTGIILIGAEIMGYSSLDLVDNLLVLSDVNQRGLYGYEARLHTTDGYDGVRYYEDPFVKLWKGFEDEHSVIGMAENKFDEHYAYTPQDGYRNKIDIVTSGKDLSVVDDVNEGFPSWDNAGWDRLPVTDYISGKCIGTYFGGEYGCVDGDGPVRGLSLTDHTNMREEYLLEITGEPVVLIRRQHEGKTSKHFSPFRENTIHRGLDNTGTSMVSGYDQFFNPRRSDGKILVRFGPTKEDYKREDNGIENTFIPACWTLVTPTVQDGDVIIRFNEDGTEEFRYEIIDVDRNRTVLQASGAQKFTAVRVRKTDPIYQFRSIRDTSTLPTEVLTGIGLAGGANGIPPHMHRIVLSGNETSLVDINQTTSMERGHSHPIIDGVVQEVLGHTHDITFP